MRDACRSGLSCGPPSGTFSRSAPHRPVSVASGCLHCGMTSETPGMPSTMARKELHRAWVSIGTWLARDCRRPLASMRLARRRTQKASGSNSGEVARPRADAVRVARCKRCRRPAAHCAAVRSPAGPSSHRDAAPYSEFGHPGAWASRTATFRHSSSTWTWRTAPSSSDRLAGCSIWGAVGSDTATTSSGSAGEQPLTRAKNTTTSRLARIAMSLRRPKATQQRPRSAARNLLYVHTTEGNS